MDPRYEVGGVAGPGPVVLVGVVAKPLGDLPHLMRQPYR